MNGAQTLTPDGRWVMAIPEPYYLLVRKRCGCGKKFWSTESYRRHYALHHLLEVES